MPLVRLEIRRGQSAAQKQALLDAAHGALVEALGIPDHDRTQRIVEHARDDPGFSGRKPRRSRRG